MSEFRQTSFKVMCEYARKYLKTNIPILFIFNWKFEHTKSTSLILVNDYLNFENKYKYLLFWL